MSAPSSPSRSSRARNAAVVVALVAVGLAARTPQAPSQPAADSAMPTPAPDSTGADTLAMQDSLAPMMADSAQPVAVVAPAPAPAAPTTWPVDPVTGQTLINGKPVVGRVFIMQKTDGTVKYPNVADVIAHEAKAPLPAVVGQSYTPAPLTNTRRMRGIMIQATLWDADTKRSAVRHRYYPVSTPANQLGQ